MEGQDVDPAPASIASDLDLPLDEPAASAESTSDISGTSCVNQVGLLAGNQRCLRPEPVANTERFEQPIKLADPKITHPTPFDPTNLGLGHAGPTTQLALTPPHLHPDGADSATDHVEELQLGSGCAHGRLFISRRSSRTYSMSILVCPGCPSRLLVELRIPTKTNRQPRDPAGTSASNERARSDPPLGRFRSPRGFGHAHSWRIDAAPG